MIKWVRVGGEEVGVIVTVGAPVEEDHMIKKFRRAKAVFIGRERPETPVISIFGR